LFVFRQVRTTWQHFHPLNKNEVWTIRLPGRLILV